MKNFLSIFFIFIAIILTCGAVNAMSIVGVSPGDVHFKNVLRGGYAQRQITISADSDQSLLINFQPRGEIKDWINVSNSSIVITKNKTGRIMLMVIPPEDVDNGNYTGFLRVTSDSMISEGKEGHLTGEIHTALDISISVEITGNAIKSCIAKDFRITSAEKGEPILLTIEFENTGNIRLKPKISLNIWDRDQTMIVKATELVKEEILPTKTESLSFILQTDDLVEGQYWADITEPDCVSSDTLTFDVLEVGTLRADGKLLSINNPRYAYKGDTIPIVANFKNTGEKTVTAYFEGHVNKDKKIIQQLKSEKLMIPINVTNNFTFYFTPKKEGDYVILGRVIYDKKKTFELSSLLTAYPIKSNLNSILVNLIYGALFILLIYVIYKVRKERKSYAEKLRRLHR